MYIRCLFLNWGEFTSLGCFFVILCILGVVPSSVFSNSAKKKEDSSLKRAVMCRVTKGGSVKHGVGG